MIIIRAPQNARSVAAFSSFFPYFFFVVVIFRRRRRFFFLAPLRARATVAGRSEGSTHPPPLSRAPPRPSTSAPVTASGPGGVPPPPASSSARFFFWVFSMCVRLCVCVCVRPTGFFHGRRFGVKGQQQEGHGPLLGRRTSTKDLARWFFSLFLLLLLLLLLLLFPSLSLSLFQILILDHNVWAFILFSFYCGIRKTDSTTNSINSQPYLNRSTRLISSLSIWTFRVPWPLSS